MLDQEGVWYLNYGAVSLGGTEMHTSLFGVNIWNPGWN